MQSNEPKDQYLFFVKNHWLPLVFTSIGIILILFGIISIVFSENNQKGLIIEEAASTHSVSSEQAEQIVVDISGAVEKPGVYKLSADSRLQEALIAAGGLSQDANRDYVSKNINLAAKISDGAKIYIPSRDESISPQRPHFAGQAGSVAGANSLININTASQAELEGLSGVGPVTAQKIIEGRPYGSIEELRVKKMVGEKAFGEIKDKVTVY